MTCVYRVIPARVCEGLTDRVFTVSPEMEACVAVSVPAKQQWRGSTGDPGGRRYTHLFSYLLFLCGVIIASFLFLYIYFTTLDLATRPLQVPLGSSKVV